MVKSSGLTGLLKKAALSIAIGAACIGGAYAKAPVGGTYGHLPSWWRIPGVTTYQSPSRDQVRKQNYQKLHRDLETDSVDDFTVGMWNMENVGHRKSRDPEFRRTLKDLVEGVDVFVGQEVRSEYAAEQLCGLVEDTHDCTYTSEAGEIKIKDGKPKRHRKEVYLFFMRKGEVEFEQLIDYNTMPTWQRRVDRPPGILQVTYNGVTKDIVTVHTDPDEAEEEMRYVMQVMRSRKNPALLTGDINICEPHDLMPTHVVYVGLPHHDTTRAKNECAYDVAKGNRQLDRLYENAHGRVLNIPGSDHYPITVTFSSGLEGAE